MANLIIWIPETHFYGIKKPPPLIGQFLHENWSIKTEIVVFFRIFYWFFSMLLWSNPRPILDCPKGARLLPSSSLQTYTVPHLGLCWVTPYILLFLQVNKLTDIPVKNAEKWVFSKLFFYMKKWGTEVCVSESVSRELRSPCDATPWDIFSYPQAWKQKTDYNMLGPLYGF
jgi:hypothetical protein